MLLRGGELAQEELDGFELAPLRQPRTAVELSEDRRTLYIVVADGRRRTSRGLDLYETARLLLELGAHDAINLDGGGSSEMFVAGAGGVVSVPSRGRWEAAMDEALGVSPELEREGEDGTREVFLRGVEREVMNHLFVMAPAASSVAPTAHGSALADGVLIEAPRPRPPPAAPSFRIGAAREWAVPLGYLLAALLALALGYRVARAVHARVARRRAPSREHAPRDEPA